METFLARQGIFDRGLNVVGYEIFFRDGVENFFAAKDGDRATAQVIQSVLHTFGVGALTQGRRAYINMTRSLLLQDLVTLLPPQNTVVEILETVAVDDAVISACKALRKAGYQIALDDFAPGGAAEPLLPLADIVKVDFRAVEPLQRAAVAKRCSRPGVRLLAEKIETRAELAMATQMGYSLYQGYFFRKPEIVSRTEVPAYKLNYLRILQGVGRSEIDFDGLEKIVRQDVSLSIKLLRYINSALFGLGSRVESIKHALVLVGVPQMRRWVALLALSAMGEDRPAELIVTALVRARFCELVGVLGGMEPRAFDLFMIGMLSLVDAIVGRPMSEIVADLPLSAEVKGGLQGNSAGLGRLLRLTLAYEKGDWHRLSSVMTGLPIQEKHLPKVYQEAVQWADQIFSTGQAASSAG
jgi:c-di-GMP-related signal transduction protein